MSNFMYALVNAILVALVAGTIVGLLVWSILTQHRDHGCENVRLRWLRLRLKLPAMPVQTAPRETPAPGITVATPGITVAAPATVAEPLPEELVLG